MASQQESVPSSCRERVTLCVNISTAAKQRAKHLAIQLGIPLKQLVEELLLAAPSTTAPINVVGFESADAGSSD